MSTTPDVLIVGAGFAGAAAARVLADAGRRVLLVEQRSHIAGNMYDEVDENGLLIHRYGPHILAMQQQRAQDFLARFTEFTPYRHKVLLDIGEHRLPLPVNLSAVDAWYSMLDGAMLKDALINAYGWGARVPVLAMRESPNPTIRDFAQQVFEKVYLHYTEKMWGLSPKDIDPSVTGRQPFRCSYEDEHFDWPIQVMPGEGYTKLFEKMLNHPNIKIQLNTPAKSVLRLGESCLLVHGQPYGGWVIYTGALDELFDCDQGALPYRSLKFDFETKPVDFAQPVTVVNYPDTRPQTRTTEYKHMTGNTNPDATTLCTETPGAYDATDANFNQPYYPINRPEHLALHAAYLKRLGKYPTLIPAGRLAEYRYYYMEDALLRGIEVAEKIVE